jgi:ATP-dependent Clp protease adaptor protein ClpS
MTTKTGIEIETDTEITTRHMPMYKVLFHNDNKTTFDFVVMSLVKIFNKSAIEALTITLEVHQKGLGLAGVFTLELAELKIDQVHSSARTAGYPLTLSMEPAE